MNHGVFGRKLGRNVGERRQLVKNLAASLILSGRVRTTLAKAKVIQPVVEKLITKVKRGTNGAIREVHKTLANLAAEKTLAEMVKSRFDKRNSGYTRIVKLGTRFGDAAEMALLEFVDAAPVMEKRKAEKAKSAKETQAAQVQEAEVVTEEKKETKKAEPKKAKK